MTSMSLLLALGPLSLVFLLSQLRRRRWLNDVRGPKSGSWLYGHKLAISRQVDVGELDFAWADEYGGAWRIDDCFGGELLMISDPAAIQHVLQVQGYGYPKTREIKTFTGLAFGRGVSWAGGETHVRHRKILAPAFTAAPIRQFLPIFRQKAAQLCQNWRDALALSSSDPAENLDISRGLTNATLDIIGESVFDYHFGSLDKDGAANEFADIFHNLFADSNLFPPKSAIIFAASWRWWPTWLLNLVQYLPARQFVRFRQFLVTGKKLGKDLIEEQAKAVDTQAKKHDDILSILVKANKASQPDNRLNEEEILSQVTTLLFAGHETTACTLTWLLYELAHHPEDQERIRSEIASRRMSLPPGQDFGVGDLEALAFLNACIREVLRMHPISPWVMREAAIHDVIPLSVPVTAKSGKLLSEIEVGPGMPVWVSTCAYNRNKTVWGEDADEWRPARFIDGSLKDQISVGLVGNTLTFSAGTSGCIGWRFAMMEMQSTMAELVESFRFSPPVTKEPIRMLRTPVGAIMAPMIEGKLDEHTQMPLSVEALR